MSCLRKNCIVITICLLKQTRLTKQAETNFSGKQICDNYFIKRSLFYAAWKTQMLEFQMVFMAYYHVLVLLYTTHHIFVKQQSWLVCHAWLHCHTKKYSCRAWYLNYNCNSFQIGHSVGVSWHTTGCRCCLIFY